MATSYLTADRLVDLSEFQAVKTKTEAQLDLWLFRSATTVAAYGPFPVSSSIADADERAQFNQEMELAQFLITERMILANPSTEAAAAGKTAETIGKYSYSRALGGSKVGTPVASEIVSQEALDILLRWRIMDPSESAFVVERTDVFPKTEIFDDSSPGRRVFVDEDADTVAPGYRSGVSGRDY